MRVTHVSMAVNASPQFYQFWPYLKRHYTENLGVTPLLTYVGHHSDDAWRALEGDEGVEYLPWQGDPSALWQVPWAKFWRASTCSDNDVVMISGMDQFPRWPGLLEQDVPDDAYVAMLHLDDYWRRDERTQPTRATNTTWHGNLPSAYQFARSRTFREIFSFSDTWADEVAKLDAADLWTYRDRPDRGKKWGIDESWSTNCLRRHQSRVNTPVGYRNLELMGRMQLADIMAPGAKWFGYEAHVRHAHWPGVGRRLGDLIDTFA